MILSDVCFLDNEFVGSGAVVAEGSIDDLTSSNVFGTVDPALECPYASIGFATCVDYDSDTCSASNPYYVRDPSAPASVPPFAAASPTIEDKTSGYFPIQTKISLVLLLTSVVLIL